MRRQTKVLLIISITIAVVVLILLSIPYVSGVKSVSTEVITDYPALLNAYNALQEEKIGTEIVAADTIHIVTIKNLWGSWDKYLLPCFAASTNTVPLHGQTTFHGYFSLVSSWSEENLFTKLCPAELTAFTMKMEATDNTFVSSSVNIYPENLPMQIGENVAISNAASVEQFPEIVVTYLIGTSPEAASQDETACADFIWEYTLSLCGQPVCSGRQSIAKNYIVGA